MQFSYFDIDSFHEKVTKTGLKKLADYRAQVQEVVTTHDESCPEYALVHAKNPSVHEQLAALKKQYKNISHLIVVGIGGSSLGLEAVHQALGEQTVKLHTLDTVSGYQLQQLLTSLATVRSVKKIAVCVISKSGGTTETMVNAGVMLDALEQRFGKTVYQQTICIGNPGTAFLETAKRLGATLVSMPEAVGGRYSVATEVGLVPLALLGHDTDAFIDGVLEATQEGFAQEVAKQAVRLHHYINKGFGHYNFFALEKRLEKLGGWYRQLTAESLGKEFDLADKPVKKGFVPTISTPVELHSVGQLYFSGLAGVYTDFVTFATPSDDFPIPKKGLSKTYGKYTVEEVAAALGEGVLAAYQDRSLPYRSTVFDDANRAYSVGLFMAMRMLEIMYVAKLMNLNAFDQPNVELYKQKTRKILGL